MRKRPNPGYREDLRAALAQMFEARADTKPGRMFGFPALYADGKLVACVYGRGIGVRVAPEDASRIRGQETPSFQPYGKQMRAWAFLEPAAAEDVRGEAPVLEAAIARAKREGART